MERIYAIGLFVIFILLVVTGFGLSDITGQSISKLNETPTLFGAAEFSLFGLLAIFAILIPSHFLIRKMKSKK